MSIRSLYPDIRPSLLLDFANARQLDPRITFTRNSTATYVGRDGLIKTAGLNQPRFDHHPTTGESLGLLIEEQRTNFRSNSTQIETQRQSLGTWTESLNTSETLAPDGSSTADKLTHSSGNIYRLYWSAGAADGSVSKTFSAYFKGVSGGETLSIDIGDTSNTDFTLTTNWQRLSVTTSSLGSGNFVDFSSLGNSFYVWGAQVEAGSFPTSYIPTSGSTVTRVADNALINQQVASGSITIVGDYKMRMTAANQWNRLFGFGEGSSDVRPFISSAPTSNIIWYNYSTNDPVTDWSALGLSIPDDVSFKFAMAIRQNVANSVSVNGTAVSTQTNTNPGAYVNWNELYLGNSDTGTGPRNMTGTIKEFRVYNDGLTDAQLQTLTK